MRIKGMQSKSIKTLLLGGLLVPALFSLSACADVNVPEARNVDIPSPVSAEKRRQAVNERPDSVMYLPLGEDVLVPEVLSDNPLPSDNVGPFELRNETLAGALQLILADYDISLAFETDEAFNRHVTVANLHGSLDKVVRRVCSLANMYCSYEDAGLIVKDMQTFTVTLPPIGSAEDSADFMSDISSGLAAVLGGDASPSVDPATRTLVYTATQRNAELADRYFQKLRASTAMIVFETYIWEVSLSSGNSMGVDWSLLDDVGKYNFSIGLDGAVATNFTNPISIGLPTTQAITTPTDVVNFLSQFGAVKSISQPQLTVLSGSSAELRVAETENYVSEVTTTLVDGGSSSTSVNTDSVDSGFTLNIGSTWDKSTVYADISIALTDVLQIDNFVFSDGGAGGTSTSIQLPQTTERELTTQVRVRPGDSVLIAGLVQEQDNFDNEGPGFMEPVLPQSRTAEASNLELVFLMRPRVVAYTAGPSAAEKAMKANALMSSHTSDVQAAAPLQRKAERMYSNRFEPGATAPASPVVSAPAMVEVTPEPIAVVPEPTPSPAPVVAAPAPAPAPSPVVSSSASQVPQAPSTYGSNFKSRYMSGESAAPVRSSASQNDVSSGQNIGSSPSVISSPAPAISSEYDGSVTDTAPSPSYDASSYSSSYMSPSEDDVEVYGVESAPAAPAAPSSYSTYGAPRSSSQSVTPSTYY